MKRRDVLAGAVVAPMLPLASRIAAAAPGLRRIRPGDEAWPDKAAWQRLNDAVEGNLIESPPLFHACEANAASAACAEAKTNIVNPFYIGDQPGGTQVSGWVDAWQPAPSVYAVHVKSATHAAAAVNFARDHNLRLVVKGGAHSYQGTSTAPDSLMIWTRAMNDVVLHEQFTPNGCNASDYGVPAVSAGGGALSIDLYDAVTTKAGRYVQCGGCTDTGVAGVLQSGGFGSHSKGFGTAAGSLLEAEVVTADGMIRIANACTNPDLFWALKGGGGGAWGVVTRFTLRTHELPKYFGGTGGLIRAKSDTAFKTLIDRFLDFYASRLLNPHWGEQAHFSGDNTIEFSMASQGLDEGQSAEAWRPFVAFVEAGVEFERVRPIRTGVSDARHGWDIRTRRSLIADKRPGAPPHHAWWDGDQDQVGVFLHGMESLWLPATLLDPKNRGRFVDALFEATRHKRVDLHFNKGLAGCPATAATLARDTATNPNVLGAFALAIIADGQAPAYPGLGHTPDLGKARSDAAAIKAATAALARVAPNGGSYVSESNFFNPDWQRAFWGGNYRRLRAVKAKYDPDGFFIAHHGVGSEDWSADGFTRL